MKKVHVERFLAGFLYIVSAGMTAFFCSIFGTDLLWKCLLFFLGLVVDALKFLAWSAVAEGKKAIAVLGFLCCLFSFVAVVFSTSVTVEKASTIAQVAEKRRDHVNTQIEIDQRQSLALVEKLEQMDPTWISKGIALSSAIREVGRSQPEVSSSPLEGEIDLNIKAISEVAAKFHLQPDLISLLFFGALSLITECGIVALTLSEGVTRRKDGTEPEKLPLGARRPTDSDFLRIATLANGEIMSRRGLVALGMDERFLKSLISRLQADGVLISQGKGKRLKLAAARSSESGSQSEALPQDAPSIPSTNRAQGSPVGRIARSIWSGLASFASRNQGLSK